MGLRKFFGLERRGHIRYPVAVDVEFLVWDEVGRKPLTNPCQGGLTNISLNGACLQTSQILIGGHHLMIHSDLEGTTPLIIQLPPSNPGEPSPWKIRAQVAWYKKGSEERRYPFDVGIKFVDLNETDRQKMHALIKSLAQ